MAKFTNIFITKNKPGYGVPGAVVPMLLPEYVWKFRISIGLRTL